MNARRDNRSYYDEFADWYENERHDGYHACIDRLETDLLLERVEDADALEVGCGTGLILRQVAPRARRAVGIDISPGMLELAHQRGLEVVQGDATALPFPDESFDVVYSFKVLAHVQSIDRALREMVRVTRRGGRVLVIAFNAPDRFEALQFFLGAIKAVVPEFEGLPADAPPLEFQVSDPAVLHRRLDDAGLRHVTVDIDHHERVDVRSGQELWDWCLGSNPIPGMLIADLGDEQKASVRGKLDEMVAARSDERGVATLTAALNIGIGTK